MTAWFRQHFKVAFILLLILGVASIVLSVFIGSVSFSFGHVIDALLIATNQESSVHEMIITLRLNRALLAFCVGASLSLAGVLIQSLFRNALADPYVLGVSGGASVGAMLMFFFCAVWYLVQIVAFAGACLVALLLYGLSYRDFKLNGQSTRILLLGVLCAFGMNALVMLFLTLAPDAHLRGMVFWLVGDLSSSSMHISLPIVLGCVFLWAFKNARDINLLTMDEQTAYTRGVVVGRLKKGLFVCATLLTALAVTFAGNIAFLGLIIPHATRLLVGFEHRFVIPSSVLLGGIFLTLADLLSRTVLAPIQIPIGIITALIGVPIFFIQLYRR